jgi:hypothetical protein
MLKPELQLEGTFVKTIVLRVNVTFAAFCLTADGGKGISPKNPVHSEAELEEFKNKEEIQNEIQYPRAGMKERRAGSMA